MKQIFKILALAISVTAFTLFTWLWWQRANMPYNEAGRYFDGTIVWHGQSVFIYALLSVFFFFMLVVTGYLVWKK